MNRIYFLLLAIVVGLAGCETKPAATGIQPAPVWEQVKIKDLAPASYNKDPNDSKIVTLFSAYGFSVPARNLPEVVKICKGLNSAGLKITDEKALASNNMQAGFGRTQDWTNIFQSLQALKTKRERLVSFTLLTDTDESFKVLGLDDEISFFYWDGDSNKGITVGPGSLVFKLRSTTQGLDRGVCELSITPAFEPFALRRKALTYTELNEFIFDGLEISAKMGPGDFVIIVPSSYVGQDATLSTYLFKNPEVSSSAQFYVLVCTGVAN